MDAHRDEKRWRATSLLSKGAVTMRINRAIMKKKTEVIPINARNDIEIIRLIIMSEQALLGFWEACQKTFARLSND